MISTQEWFDKYLDSTSIEIRPAVTYDPLTLNPLTLTGEVDLGKHTRLTSLVFNKESSNNNKITKIKNLPVTLVDLRVNNSLFLEQNVKDFAHLTNLYRVYLNDTKIYGDISAFYDMNRLNHLNIKNTKITGDSWRLPLSVSAFESDWVIWWSAGDRQQKQPIPWRLIESSMQQNQTLQQQISEFQRDNNTLQQEKTNLESDKNSLTTQLEQLNKDKQKLEQFFNNDYTSLTKKEVKQGVQEGRGYTEIIFQEKFQTKKGEKNSLFIHDYADQELKDLVIKPSRIWVLTKYLTEKSYQATGDANKESHRVIEKEEVVNRNSVLFHYLEKRLSPLQICSFFNEFNQFELEDLKVYQRLTKKNNGDEGKLENGKEWRKVYFNENFISGDGEEVNYLKFYKEGDFNYLWNAAEGAVLWIEKSSLPQEKENEVIDDRKYPIFLEAHQILEKKWQQKQQIASLEQQIEELKKQCNDSTHPTQIAQLNNSIANMNKEIEKLKTIVKEQYITIHGGGELTEQALSEQLQTLTVQDTSPPRQV